jgi:DnaJ-class molecular chaperone
MTAENESHESRVARIQRDHNVSLEEAERVARSEERLIARRRQCAVCRGTGYHPRTTSTHCPACYGVGIELRPGS